MAGLTVRRWLIAASLALGSFAIAFGAPGNSPTPHWVRSLPGTWTLVDRGARGGETWAGPSDGIIGAVYLPAAGSRRRRLSVVYLLTPRATPELPRTLRIAQVADQLGWQGATVPFAVVSVTGSTAAALPRAMRFAQAHLPVRRDRNGSVLMTVGHRRSRTQLVSGQLAHAFRTIVEIGVPPNDSELVTGQALVTPGARMPIILAVKRSDHATPRSVAQVTQPGTHALVPITRTSSHGGDGPALWHQELYAALTTALAPVGANRASAAATGLLPPTFSRIAVGPAGGTIWQGVIPGARWRAGPRPSLIYLPPGVDRRRRYPVIYLLHGIRGAPYSFLGGLRLTMVADQQIASHSARPFIAVMPPAGNDASYRGEWTGIWEDYVVGSVVPYVDRTLPTVARPQHRSIAGLSAGGYGAVDIALRHPGVFGTVEAWSGYFTAPRDGSLAHASARELAAHDPSVQAQRQARPLRAAGVRFYLAAGAQDREALAPTRLFASELTSLGLRPTLVVTPGGHTTGSWRAALPGALSFAVAHA